MRRAIPAVLLLAALVLAGLQASPSSAGGGSARIVMGFLPYWTIDGFSPEGWRLTDIVYFSAPVRQDGSLDLSHVQEDAARLEEIRSECGGCRIHLAVTLFDPSLADRVLAEHRIELANSIRSAVLEYGFDGVNLDFEMLHDKNTVTGQDNTDLLLDLIHRIRSGTSIIVGIDVMGGVEKVYRDERLAQAVDYVYLMAYDYHYSGSERTGSVSPLHSTGLSIEWSLGVLEQYYPPSKIVLGLPLYGYDWPAQDCQPGAPTLGRGKARTLAYIEEHILPEGAPHWDSEAASPWVSYNSGGQCRQVWYENATSIAIKADYALSRGLAGIGFWALGYTGDAGSGPLLRCLTRSRSAEPGADAVVIYSNGSRVIVRLEGARALSGLRVAIRLSGASLAGYEKGDIGPLAGLEARQESNGTIILEATASEPLPGCGLWGNGTLATLDLTGEPSIQGATATGYALRLAPDRSTYRVYATITRVVVEAGNGTGTSTGPGGGGSGSVGGVIGTVPSPPSVAQPRGPRVSVGWIGVAAVLAALALAAFFMLSRILF